MGNKCDGGKNPKPKPDPDDLVNNVLRNSGD